MATEIIIEENRQEAIAQIISVLRQRMHAPGRLVFGLCGGRSIVSVLEQLRDSDIEPSLWKNVQFFMLDERLVPLDSVDSNFRLVRELFLQSLLEKGFITEGQLYPFPTHLPLEQALELYQQQLISVGGKFDVSFLGVGEDAHVAALFPKHAALHQDHRLFVALHDSPKPPKERMSASRGLIEKSDLAVALFFGEGKRQAMESYLDEGKTWEQCPVKIINNVSSAYVLSDIQGLVA